MDPLLQGIPEYEFEQEGVVFSPQDCDHGSVPAEWWQAVRADLMLQGDEGEDHLLAPHVILAETFHGIPETPDPALEHAANPVQDPEAVWKAAKAEKIPTLNELFALQQNILEAPDDEAARLAAYHYARKCNSIAKHKFSIEDNLITPESANAKLGKGVGFDWSMEGLSLLPSTLAGINDLCPFSSKSCTANCLNFAGRTEIGGPWATNKDIRARKRRTFLYYWQPDVFFVRLVTLINSAAEKAGVERYCFRPNVYSDIPWEKMPFFNPWAKGPTSILDAAAVPNKDGDLAPIQFYDYTKNPSRYEDMLTGKLPANYHLTFSMSEMNALYAFYALDHGGSVAVVFDTPVAIHGYAPKPAGPLPKKFCGYRVIDGDLSDLRFLDREKFKIPEGEGFVVGLRLKGRKYRRNHFARLNAGESTGFIFPENVAYTMDGVIRRSEECREIVEKEVKPNIVLPGVEHRQEYWAGIPPNMVKRLTSWWKGKMS